MLICRPSLILRQDDICNENDRVSAMLAPGSQLGCDIYFICSGRRPYSYADVDGFRAAIAVSLDRAGPDADHHRQAKRFGAHSGRGQRGYHTSPTIFVPDTMNPINSSLSLENSC
jgi:hypothetical protein